MKMKKRTLTMCAAVVGAMLLTASALADVMIGSGYQGLKDAVRTTAAALADELDNFTGEMVMECTFDGERIGYYSTVEKFDGRSGRVEVRTKEYDYRGPDWHVDTYRYIEPGRTVSHYADDETYRVMEGQDVTADESRPSNPFEDESADDIERIFDALVGSLSDVVSVEESGGQKLFSASVNEAQVPALVNALTSFVIKETYFNEYNAREYGLTRLVSDVYVTEASCRTLMGESGILENGVVHGALTGRDEAGQEHTVTAEFTFAVTGIGSTTVEAPDLTGKQVETYQAGEMKEDSGLAPIYLGRYRSDILARTLDGVEKIGERTLEISASDAQTVTGRYYETYRDDITDAAPLDFTFTGELDDGQAFFFDYTDATGESKMARVFVGGSVESGFDAEIAFDAERLEGGYGSQGPYYNMYRVFD